MKKIMFMLLLTMVFSIAISSCTEEAIQPTNADCGDCGHGNGGGGVSEKP